MNRALVCSNALISNKHTALSQVRTLSVAFLTAHFFCSSAVAEDNVLQLAKQLCADWSNEGKLGPVTGAQGVTVEPIQVGIRHLVQFADQTQVEMDVVNAAGREIQYLATYLGVKDKPEMLVSLSADCTFRLGRRIQYDYTGLARYLVGLDPQLHDAGEQMWINPPLPEAERISTAKKMPARVRVGMIDSGVNYLLPEINQRLARTPDGELIGYDFWDLDPLPFDAHPSRSAFFIQRHGTRTASLLLEEAPGIELVPYRYPRPDMSRMQALIEHASKHDVQIIGMPLGGNKQQDWQVFYSVAVEYPTILFIASAGNNGRDIDQQPLYPAALTLPNLLVVTSADDFVRPAERTNWGASSVDFMIPAELLSVMDFTGEQTLVSGSSYAVSRLTALAANIKQQHRGWSATQIIAELKNSYSISLDSNWVAEGYIPDPLVANANVKRQRVQLEHLPVAFERAQFSLPLSIQVLDTRWSSARIENLLAQAFDILAQCDIAPGEISVDIISSADHLQHLSVGGAYTLFGPNPRPVATAVLANDTRMQDPYEAEAFGLGNTSTRPWLRNSVWLLQSIEDDGIALAHELMHIMSNDGAHVQQAGNLMLDETGVDNTDLTNNQCQRAHHYGRDSGLLLPVP